MDPVMYFFPLRWHTAQLLLGGEMPWWNRSILNGTPLFANPQSAVGYPFHWIMFIRPGGGAYSGALLLQFGLFSAMSFALLRRIGCSWPAALFAAGLCLAGRYGWTRLQLGNFMNILPWWPLWLFAGYGFVRSPGSPSLAGGSLALAMMLLGGAHQMAAYGLLGLSLLLLPSLMLGPNRSRWLGFLTLSGVLGALIGMPGFLPQWAYLRETSRSAGLVAEDILVGTTNSPISILRQLAGSGDSVLALGPFALAVATSFPEEVRHRRLWTGAWIAILVTSLLACRPVVRVLLDVVPLFGLFHDPKRILGHTVWLLVLAAGLGLHNILSPPQGDRGQLLRRHAPPVLTALLIAFMIRSNLSVWTLTSLLLVPALVLGAHLGNFTPGRIKVGRTLPSLTVMLFALVALGRQTFQEVDVAWRPASELVGGGPPALLASAKLQPGDRFYSVDWKRDFSYDFRRPDLRESALPNLSMLWGIEDIGGYEPARSARYDRWLSRASTWPGHRQPWVNYFGLPYPGLPDSDEFKMLGEAQSKFLLLPRWGIPVYLHPQGPNRWSGRTPNWGGDLQVGLLYRPRSDSPDNRVLHVVDVLGRSTSYPLNPEDAVPAMALSRGEIVQTDEGVSRLELAPEVKIQQIEPGKAGGFPVLSAMEVEVGSAEAPVWAFLWGSDLEAGYPPQAAEGLRMLTGVHGKGSWARVFGKGDEAGSGKVETYRIGANRLELRVEWNGTGPGVVRIHDAWWPGWSAWVGGNPVDVLPSGERGEGLWREIEIPPGASEILLTYRPPLLTVSLVVCGLGLFLLLGTGWWADLTFSKYRDG